MVASLLSGLDPELCGFKDQILAGETHPRSLNAYSRLSCFTLEQSSAMRRSMAPSSASSESSTLVSSTGNHGMFQDTRHSSSRLFRGGGRMVDVGSQMHHCSTNHYAALGYFSTSESHDALTTQIT